ncbi:MAG TPA: nucleoside monophosphate kinase, partial [Anaeromyxobacteraceae bacterium]|nr:nucleoside monophosphate kinase [Anaeromyxobacteraceae bacterium]
KLLAQDLGVPHISTGDMFRDHKARATEIGKKVQAIMDAGGLVPDEITNDMVKERLGRPDLARGFILDGYPRTTAQAGFLDALLRSLGRRLDRVLDYQVAPELLVERMSGRRSCPRCGAVYHVSASPPRKAGVCDRDGAELVLRADDRPETVARRLQEYEAKTEPLKRWYGERGALAEVSGVGSPEEILAAAKRLLGRG